MTAALALAFAAGTVATVNPCGFALLPAYLTRRLATGTGDSRPVALARALLVGVATTGGFVAVFAVVGSAIALGARFLTAALPWAGLAIGVALAAAGVSVLAGRHIGLRLPILGRHRRGGLRGDVLFGVGYGTASLSCALPVFLAATGSALTGGLATSVLAFAAYAAGMGAVLTGLALAAALAREELARALRRTLPYVERASGGLLVLAGGYVVYYWTFALRGGARAPIDGGGAISSRLGGWLSSPAAQMLAAALLAAVGAVALGSALRRPRPRLRLLLHGRVGWLAAALLVPAALAGTALALAGGRGGAVLDRGQLRGFVEPSVPAPPFALANQDGRVVRLAALRGRPVVIAFVYSHCRDICPLTAARVRAAQRLLGTDSGKVAWLAVSVDPGTDTAASVRAFSRRYGLLDRWGYLFRPRRRVLATLRAYGIQPQLTERSAAQAPFQQHSAYISLLDDEGRRVESFTGQTLSAADLAHDLRLLLAAAGLAPRPPARMQAGRQAAPIANGRSVAAARPQASIRNGVLSLSGSDLASGRLVRLDAYPGRPVVIDVWASWCAGCAAEAPALAAFARAHPEAQVVGVDVEDTQAAGRAFIRRFGLPYPSVFDAAGATTIPLQVKGLPTTIFLDRAHRVAARIVGETDRAGFEHGLQTAASR